MGTDTRSYSQGSGFIIRIRVARLLTFLFVLGSTILVPFAGSLTGSVAITEAVSGCGLVYNCTFSNNGDGWSHPSGAIYNAGEAQSTVGGVGSDYSMLTGQSNETTGYYHIEFDYNSPCQGNIGLGVYGSGNGSSYPLHPPTGGTWVHVSQDVRDNSQHGYNSFFLEYCLYQGFQGPPYPSLRNPYVQWVSPQSTPNQNDMTGGGSASENKPYCVTPRPVNCATGEFYHTFDDLSVPGRGIPLHLSRTYSSFMASTNGPFGYGWTDNYNMFLTTDASGAVTVNEETGTKVIGY